MNYIGRSIPPFFCKDLLRPIVRHSSKTANVAPLFLFHPEKALQKLEDKQIKSIALSKKDFWNPIQLSLLYREASASKFVEKFCPKNAFIPPNQKVIIKWDKLKEKNKYDKMVEFYNSSQEFEFTKEKLSDYLDAFLRSTYFDPKFAVDLSEIILKEGDENSESSLNYAIALDAQAKIAKKIAQMNETKYYDVNSMKIYKKSFENSPFEKAADNHKITSKLAYQQFKIAYQNKKTDLNCLYLIFASLEIGKMEKAIELANDMWSNLETKSIQSEQQFITSIILSVILFKQPQELIAYLHGYEDKVFFSEAKLKTFKRTITQIFKYQELVSYQKKWKEIRDHLSHDLFTQ